MNFLIVIICVFILLLLNENDKLKKENKSLKEDSTNKVNFCPKCGYSFNISPPIISNSSFIENKNFNKKKKEKYTDKEIKNSLILVTGSILIVLAAIAFLTSTWNITHNIVKTGVILFMLVVFLAISYISDKYLKLKQTSRSFYYIALAYIPIILLSISMFSLFGNYLSLNGNGRYIYLFVSSILVSLIYYVDSKKQNNKVMFSFSVIFQLLSIIFFILIFINNRTIILSGLLIYSIIICVLYLKNNVCFNKEIHFNLSGILFVIMTGLLLNNNLISIISNNVEIYDVIAIILLFINMYLVLVKIWNKNDIYKFLYPLFIVLIFNNFSYLFDNMMFRQSLILASFAVIYIYNLVKENKINIITHIETLVIFSIFNTVWMFGSNLLDSYILFGIMTVFNLVNCVFDEEYRYYSSSVLSIGIIITAISITLKFDLSSIFIGYIAFLLILVDMLLKKLSLELRTTFKWVGIIGLILVTLINLEITIWAVLLFIIFFVSSLINGILNKSNLYRIMGYVYSNIVLFSILELLNWNYFAFVIPFTTLVITFVEYLIPSLRNNSSDNYLIISYICSNIMLIDLLDIYGFVVILLLNIVLVYYINYYKKHRNYLCIPFLGMIPYIYLSGLLIFNSFNFMYFISIIALVIITLFIYIKQYNIYIVMFYLYNFFHIITLSENKYVTLLLLILGTMACYLIKNNKVKDIYKGILYILGLILYNTILMDLNINNITVLNIGIYIILTLLFTRTIFKKYSNNYKIWEYVLCIIINLIALSYYSSQFDGIMYVSFLTIMVIISYIYKFGPIFLIGLFFIVFNVLLLIDSIPWWIYILIIGGILIGFAIYNEVKDNNKSKFDIKKHLDL